MRFPAKTDPLSHCHEANDVWCIDFKGWWKTLDGLKCDPLTLTDAHSRFILRCIKLQRNNAEMVWEALKEAFLEYGLPLYLRHDNGPPFATPGAGRLSRFSVCVIKTGVITEWIDPASPYQNGRHERMHSTLHQEGRFPELTLEEQQLKFADFVKYYNNERFHEGIGLQIPGRVYVPSSRVWDGKLRSPEYCEDCTVKRVRERGQISWNGKDIYIGKALSNENIAVKEAEEGWFAYFGPILLGVINYEGKFIIPRIEKRRKEQGPWSRVY